MLYNYFVNPKDKPFISNEWFGFNTGGHAFQFYIGNTTDATNINQLSRNTNFIKDGQLALGLRLNRSFFVGKE
ncbi:MAG: DUF5777 family beta-barrel protein [Saprospiraceae bacterium]